jgi:hypothetical protein
MKTLTKLGYGIVDIKLITNGQLFQFMLLLIRNS